MSFSTSLPLSLLASWKINQLNRCYSVPQYYISIEGWRIDKQLKTTIYTIEIGVKNENNVLLFNIEKRYSELRIIHKILSNNSKISLPIFPPRKFFGNFNEEFIRSRHYGLKKYFEGISSINNIDQPLLLNDLFHFNL